MGNNDFVVKNMTNKIIKMLEVSKGNIENIINSLPNIVAIIKYNGSIFSGNNKLAQLLDIDKEDLIKTNFNSLFKTPEWVFFQNNLNKIERNEVSHKEFPLQLNKKNNFFKMPLTYLWDAFLYEKVLKSGEKLFLIIGKDISEITYHQKELKKMNSRLEEMVEERTAKLREKTKDIANMLQNMKQGIFTILPNKTIHKEYSHHLEELFKDHNIVGKNALDFLFKNSTLGGDKINQMEASLSNILEQDIMTFQINEDLFVKEFQKEINNKKRFLELDWNPILDEDETVQKVLVNVKDVTEFKQLQLDMGAKKRELEIIGEILHITTTTFLAFTESALSYIEENKKIIKKNAIITPEIIQILFRNMHTIKGNARTYELKNLTDVIHKVENRYDELRKSKSLQCDQELLLFDIEEAKNAIIEYKTLCEEKLLDVQESSTPPEDNFLKKFQKIFNHHSKSKNKKNIIYNEAEKLFNYYNSENFTDVISDISKGLQGMAKDLNKPSPKVQMKSANLRIFKPYISTLKDVFVHCFRNSLDHGIESVEEREETGKTPQGTIFINVRYQKAFAVIQFFDDGRGLDIPKIRKQGIQKNIILQERSYSDEHISQLIFHSGLSTARDVSLISGRGIGMDAVLNLITKKGAFIDLNFNGNKNKNGFRPFEIIIKIPLFRTK
jgi:HPt (histidine-containing phosphotransfer) domain-containing protein